MALCRFKQTLLWHSIALCLASTFLKQDVLGQACVDCRSSSSVGIVELQEKPSSLANPASWTIRKRVDEVMVFFTVTKGRIHVDDLGERDIRITDDYKPPLRISMFGHQSDLPLRLGLLVDVSDSVQSRFTFEKEASMQFVRNILRPRTDEIFVTTFSQQVNLAQDYTSDPDQLARSISALTFGGKTAMYDAILESCEKLTSAENSEPSARILLVLSDGDDNSSRSTLNQVIELAQRREVTIYAISTNNSYADIRGDGILKLLALETGGKAFFPHSARDIKKAFNLLEQDMRGRYVVSYQPSSLNLDGKFHQVQIFAEKMRKRLHVQARKGYYAPLKTGSQ